MTRLVHNFTPAVSVWYKIPVDPMETEEEKGPWWKAFCLAEAQFKATGQWPRWDDPDPLLAQWARFLAVDFKCRRAGERISVGVWHLTTHRWLALSTAGYVEPQPKSKVTRTGGPISEAKELLDQGEQLPDHLLTKLRTLYASCKLGKDLERRLRESKYRL